MKPLLSVIIPLYNNAHYITRCVESIIAQDFRDDQPIEIIIVNDGSTDNAIEVVTNLQKKYEIIRLLNQENKGVSAARNRGIDEAKGKYIYFIDPDDGLRPCYFSYFLDILERHNTNVLYFDLILCDTEEFERQSHMTNNIKEIQHSIKSYSQLSYTERIGIIKYIISRQLILSREIRFNNNLIIAEDTIWLNSLLSINNEKIIMIDESVYLYYQNPNSVMHTKDKNRIKAISYNYIYVVMKYIEMLSKYPIDAVFSGYLYVIEIPLYVERYLNAYYQGIIFKPFKKFIADISFLKSQSLYPIKYKSYSFKTFLFKHIINHSLILFAISLFKKFFLKR